MAEDGPSGMIGYGSKVRIQRATESAFVELDLVGDVELSGQVSDEIETTNQQSKGRQKEFIAGLTDNGEFGVPMNYIPGSTTDTLIKAIRASGEEVLIEVTLGASGSPEVYAGFCKGYARTAPVNDKMTATATFRLSAMIDASAGEGGE